MEAVLWAMGATALVSFGMSLFALQSKVRSDPLSHCQKGHFINRSDSLACGEYLVGVSFRRCWEHLNAKPLARFPRATPAVGFKTDWIAVDAQLRLLLKSVFVSVKLIPHVQQRHRVKLL